MRLKHVKVNPSNLCNLTCQFCPRGNPEIYPNENVHMTMETFRKILEGLSSIKGHFYFEMIGHGEPTLGKNFAQMSRELYEAKKLYPDMVTRLTTNGARFDRYVEEIALYDEITLDVYTDDEDVYWSQLVKYKHLNLINCNMINSVGKLRLHWDCDSKEVTPMNGEMLLFDRTGKFEIPHLGPLNPPNHGFCVRPDEDITINWNGDYILCCEDWDHKALGNVHKESLHEYYTKNETLLQYRDKLNNNIRCGQCEGCGYPGNNKYMGNKPWLKDYSQDWWDNINERLERQANLPDYPNDNIIVKI